MGQRKGNPTPTVQQQAYMNTYGASAARTNSGTTPVMLDDNTTLNEVVDITFETDAVAAMVSASLNTTIYAVSASIGNNITAVSSSIETTLASKALTTALASANATITAVSSSTNTRIESVISTGTQLASIMAYTASLLSVKLHSGSLVNYANDAAAETGGVPVGNLYHTTGTVKVRLT